MKKSFVSLVLVVCLLLSNTNVFGVAGNLEPIVEEVIVNGSAVEYTTIGNKTIVDEEGKITIIELGNNGEIFVNGRNIAKEIYTPSKKNLSDILISNQSLLIEDWKYAGKVTLEYDIALLTIGVAAGVLKVIGKMTLAKATALLGGLGATFINDNLFKADVRLYDVQRTWYKNIQQPRPDMKIVHDISIGLSFWGASSRTHLTSFTIYS